MFKLRFLALAILLLTAIPTIAQEISFPLPLGEKQRAIAGIMMGPVFRTMFDGDRSGVMLLGLAMNPMFAGFKEEFGVTEEQIKQIQDSMRNLQKPENFESSFKDFEKKIEENLDYAPTEEEDAMLDALFNEVFDKVNEATLNVFTPEQLDKMQGMMFVMMGGLESPFLDEKSMNVLNLTDEQKEKLEAIRKDTKDDRNKMLDEFAGEMRKFFKKGKIDLKELEAFGEKFKKYSEDLKKRRMDVLTETQLVKAADLMSKPPKFLTATAMKMLPDWMPGVNSWKPGDGAPDKKLERKSRRAFPKKDAAE